MYIELIKFERGSFLKREEPFFSKQALTAYDKIVAKFSKGTEEVMIALRHDNHLLVKSWTNVKAQPTGAAKIKVLLGR